MSTNTGPRGDTEYFRVVERLQFVYGPAIPFPADSSPQRSLRIPNWAVMNRGNARLQNGGEPAAFAFPLIIPAQQGLVFLDLRL